MLRGELRRIRDAVCRDDTDRAAFRVNLGAHSMGGLIGRSYLQNPNILDLDGGRNPRKQGVAKLFTYATPHRGIEFRRGLGWAEGLRDFLDANNQANFGRERMQGFLDLDDGDDLATMKHFDVRKVFCVVGTDSHDYGAAGGLSRFSCTPNVTNATVDVGEEEVGPSSDGLVQVDNAYVKGASRSHVLRSHSGHYLRDRQLRGGVSEPAAVPVW